MQPDSLNFLKKNSELIPIQGLPFASFSAGICPDCLGINCVKEDGKTICREYKSITMISQEEIPTMTVISGNNLFRILESNQYELKIRSETQ